MSSNSSHQSAPGKRLRVACCSVALVELKPLPCRSHFAPGRLADIRTAAAAQGLGGAGEGPVKRTGDGRRPIALEGIACGSEAARRSPI
jgi:hypothetical protein